jgi:hypothetical protein
MENSSIVLVDVFDKNFLVESETSIPQLEIECQRRWRDSLLSIFTISYRRRTKTKTFYDKFSTPCSAVNSHFILTPRVASLFPKQLATTHNRKFLHHHQNTFTRAYIEIRFAT